MNVLSTRGVGAGLCTGRIYPWPARKLTLEICEAFVFTQYTFTEPLLPVRDHTVDIRMSKKRVIQHAVLSVGRSQSPWGSVVGWGLVNVYKQKSFEYDPG